MKVALVYDRVTKWGGAERVLLALHAIWPQAPLYTAVYDAKRATWANVFRVHSSFLSRIPGATAHHEWYPWLTPLAFEQFHFDEYDLVISVTSAEAKYILTKPETMHICYCLTPTRYLWSGYHEYEKRPSIGNQSAIAKQIFTWIAPTLRRWDSISSHRPDAYVAISEHVGKRIQKYYGQTPQRIIYPPVDPIFVSGANRLKRNTLQKKPYFLAVGRFVGYKRLDIVIEACNRLKAPLIVIGSGWEERTYRKLAGDTIQFISRHLTDQELVGYYEGCSALLYAGDEDFGLVAAEAQACKRPVIAYKNSGVSEIITDGKTGIFFEEKSVRSLMQAIQRLDTFAYDTKKSELNTNKFSTAEFQKQMKAFIETIHKRRNS